MDHENKIILQGLYGSDETHALSAWTSTSRDLTEQKRNRIPVLLKMLATGSDGNSHGTPFEKSAIHFLVHAEIASHIHFLKHRIGVSCVTGDTLIHCQSDSKRIKKIPISHLWDIQENGIYTSSVNGKNYRRKDNRRKQVKTLNSENYLWRSHINKVFCNGEQPVFKFTTTNGSSIKCTSNHKFLIKDEGWLEIGKALNLKIINGRATFSNKKIMVALNGTKDNPWKEKVFFKDVENKMSRIQAAKYLNMNYNTLKKWGYVHNINFLVDENCGIKKGNIPWNKNHYGYSAFRPKNGRNKTRSINTYSSYKIWRATVGEWTREQMPSILKKYNYTCQGPSNCHSRDFNVHHLIPVHIAPELACEYENLILVCKNCHKEIHKSNKSWIQFEQTVYKREKPVEIDQFYNRTEKKGNRLKPHYEEITHVEYMGIETVYDLEVENTHNYVANNFIIHNCNGQSARYGELKEDEFYIPYDWPEKNKQELEKFCFKAYDKYHKTLKELIDAGMDKKRAKESARFYLPYATQLWFDIQFNFRSFVHFLKLRNAPGAQLEIREIASEMLRLVVEDGRFKHSLAAFGLDLTGMV